MIISCYNWIRCIEIHWTPRFQFKHNVCGRRTYGEGVADAVQFIARKAAEKSEKKAESQLGKWQWVGLTYGHPPTSPHDWAQNQNSNTEPRFRLRGSWYIENHISNILKRTLSVLLGLQC
jgi:hypothetical protein